MSIDLQGHSNEAAQVLPPAPIDLKAALNEKIKRSDKDSKTDWKLAVGAAFLVLGLVLGTYFFFFSGTVMRMFKSSDEMKAQLEATLLQPSPDDATRLHESIWGTDTFTDITIAGGSPTPAIEMPTMTPDIPATVESILLQRMATPVPPTPELEQVVIRDIEYVEVEVTRVQVVTNTVVVEIQPTATPSLAIGQLRICIYLEGATGLYINGVGLPGNRCFDYVAGSSINDYYVKVTR